MQFEPATFAKYGVKADPNQPLSPYNPADAIYSAAAMLCANGGRGGSEQGIRQALFAYNHATWYVNEVLATAARYASPQVSGDAARAIAFAEAQIGKPYEWGADGPNAYDCSGLVYAAYASAGVTIARTTFSWRQDGPQVPLDEIQPGDLLFPRLFSNSGHSLIVRARLATPTRFRVSRREVDAPRPPLQGDSCQPLAQRAAPQGPVPQQTANKRSRGLTTVLAIRHSTC